MVGLAYLAGYAPGGEESLRNGLLPGTISLEFSKRLFLGNHSQGHTVPRSTPAPELIRIYGNVYDKEGRMTDGKVLDIPTNSHHSDKIYIWFMVGECLHMPSNSDRCDYFLRFSSKVSGRLTTPAELYIRSVYQIAKKHFGSRVHF
jgi:hypothetical protein